MWRHPRDPTIYGSMDVDMSRTLPFLEQFRARTGRRLTVTHLAGRAVARAFATYPELNAKIRFWGRLEERTSVDVFVSVATDGGRDLSGARIDDADTLDLDGWVDALEAKASGIREHRDPSYEKSRTAFRRMPWWLVRPAISMTDLLSNELGLHLPSLGMPSDPFGTAVVTNVGTFGIDTAFAPFVPLARCPMLLLITEVRDRVVPVDGKPTVRPTLRLCASFDHRVIDGFAAGRVAKVVRTYMEDPEGVAGAELEEAA